MKHSQASSSKPASKAATGLRKQDEDLRERILESYVHDNILDLSTASDFYQRLVAVTEALTDHVERLPGSRYKLKSGFDAFFRQSFRLFLAGDPSQPADALAYSFFRMAQAWANSMHVDSLPGDWSCTGTEALRNEWKQSWKRIQEKEWDGFRQMSSPIAQYIGTALDEVGNVDHELCYVPSARHVCLGISFAQKMHEDPEMRILIKGDPAVSFMIAYIRKSLRQKWPRDQRQELRNLRVIYESAVSAIEKEFLGLTGPKGRPRDIGERAHIFSIMRGSRYVWYRVNSALCATKRTTAVTPSATTG